ncbi:MAG: hypothetical protein MUO39_02160, partial [Steroidobacteraceae bacterium]|nr:hypothetical protein [Steroidobacteraceae bacterium]
RIKFGLGFKHIMQLAPFATSHTLGGGIGHLASILLKRTDGFDLLRRGQRRVHHNIMRLDEVRCKRSLGTLLEAA